LQLGLAVEVHQSHRTNHVRVLVLEFRAVPHVAGCKQFILDRDLGGRARLSVRSREERRAQGRDGYFGALN
jgi:hypothetical protein